MKKTKIATSEKTPVHKSAANGTGTLAQKTRFRQGEQPTLLSRILPLLRNRKIKTEIRQFYWAFVCKFFGKKRVLCVLSYLLQIGDFFRTASFVFGRLQFFSRTMPLSREPLLPIYVTRGGGEDRQVRIYRTLEQILDTSSNSQRFVHLSLTEDFSLQKMQYQQS